MNIIFANFSIYMREVLRYEKTGNFTGGDAPGLNAVIRAVAKVTWAEGAELYGFRNGYSGLIKGDYLRLEKPHISGLLHKGGTMLSTNNRDNPFNFPVKKGIVLFTRICPIRLYKTLKTYKSTV